MSVKAIADGLVVLGEKIQHLFDAGKRAEYDRFWDDYQNNGNRADYTNGFGGCWTAENFKPKYDLKPITAYMMFRYIKLGGADFVEYLNNIGRTLDFSNCSQMQYTFSGANIGRLGVIDITQTKGQTTGLFNYSAHIHTIDLLKVAETNTDLNIFESCSGLKNITIEGVIARNFITKSSPLTVESATSVINALKDYSGTTSEYTYSVTFSPTTLSLLDAEGATAPGGVTWREYVNNKKWNI